MLPLPSIVLKTINNLAWIEDGEFNKGTKYELRRQLTTSLTVIVPTTLPSTSTLIVLYIEAQVV